MNPNSDFLYGHPTQEQREFLHELVELGLNFVEGSGRNGLVLQHATNERLKALFAEALPAGGMGLDELYALLRDKVAAYSIAQSDPRYMAFPDTGNSMATIGADIVCSFLNQNLIAVDRSAPSATFVELQLISWLRELVGYSSFSLNDEFSLKDVGGTWTSGGNMSNHIAILVALHRRFPDLKKSGLVGLKKRPAIILAKGIEHFSFATAALALGLGADSLLWVKANGDYTTDADSIEETLATCPETVEPFMVVSVAGNCRTTGIDDLCRVRRICDDFGLWHHVDACHGGSLLFSPDLRGRLTGIEAADSVSLDPHKGLFVTYPSSYVLFREPDSLSNMSRYPEKVSDPACLDLGLITPFFGSRGFHSLKLWLLIKHLGVHRLAEVVESRQAINLRLTAMVEEMGLFVILNRNDFYRLAFIFCPDELRERLPELSVDEAGRMNLERLINRYTEEYCSTLYRSGRVVFDLFTLQDLDDRVGLGSTAKYSVMAMAVGHPIMNEQVEMSIHREMLRVGLECRERMLRDVSDLYGQAEQSQANMNHGPAGW